jgi:hypothetical protein
MARRADHEGLAPSACHQLRPFGPWLSRLAEIGELSDLMDAHLARVPADLAPVRQEPGNQLLMADDARDRETVGEDRVPSPPLMALAESPQSCSAEFPTLLGIRLRDLRLVVLFSSGQFSVCATPR